MGRLRPGATYIYEHADGVTYAREFGAPAADRFEIGRTIERQKFDHAYQQNQFWADVVEAAESNAALQDALDRAIMIYRLSEKND